MTTFMCWCPDDGDEDSAKPFTASQHYQAAEQFAESNWANLDYSEEFEVCVRLPFGEVIRYTVDVEKVVTFTALPATAVDRDRENAADKARLSQPDRGILDRDADNREETDRG